jgi:hypothetical protein
MVKYCLLHNVPIYEICAFFLYILFGYWEPGFGVTVNIEVGGERDGFDSFI